MERRPLRVFTFLLMMTVATVGILSGYRLITGRDLVNLAEFGVGSEANISSLVAGTPTAPTTAPRPSPTPQPTAAPTPTRMPDKTQIMVVGNTDGQGVYVRRTPRMEDKLQAFRDGTRMEVLGDSVDGEGKKWSRVRTPDGAEGYIPEQFLVTLP